MIHTLSDAMRYARSYEAPKHSESELRNYLIDNGADYYDASSIAHNEKLLIENSEWNDGRYWDENGGRGGT
jgi:hypothetical protein